MDTKRNNSFGKQKAGRSQFGRILAGATGVAIGVGSAEGMRRIFSSSDQQDDLTAEEVEKPVDETAEEAQKETEKEDEAQQHAETSSQTGQNNSNNEPHPTEPRGDTQQPTHEEAVDEVAQRIVGTDEIDPDDITLAAIMKIGEEKIMFTEDGNEVRTFIVNVNLPGMEGQQFYLADDNGDGVFNHMYDMEGTPVNYEWPTTEGTVTLADLLEDSQYRSSDIESLRDNSGGYMARNEEDEGQEEKEHPEDDIRDTNHRERSGETAHNSESDDDIDESELEALLAQLFEDDDENEAEEGEGSEEVYDLNGEEQVTENTDEDGTENIDDIPNV